MNLPNDFHPLCVMNSSKPLTQEISDVLMFNAVDMFENNVDHQRIKGRSYDGIIDSNLEVNEGMGFPVVIFKAVIATGQWDVAEVDCFVRIDDLGSIHLNQGVWNRMIMSVSGLPAGLIQKMMEWDGETVSLQDLPEEIREVLERKIAQITGEDEGPDIPEFSDN